MWVLFNIASDLRSLPLEGEALQKSLIRGGGSPQFQNKQGNLFLFLPMFIYIAEPNHLIWIFNILVVVSQW